MADKLLFTPGPLTTSEGVKRAMLRDYGSRDAAFLQAVADIRQRLLALGGASEAKGYDAVIMQGSGTFGVESVLQTAVPRNGHLLLLINGAYGERMASMAETTGIRYSTLNWDEDTPVNPQEVAAHLDSEPGITHVAVVHCETTSGLFNPVQELGQVLSARNLVYIVDAMSSFGAVPLDMETCAIHYLVSSSNKCIEGVPGFSFALVNTGHLEGCAGNSRSLSLDLYAQWKGLQRNGQFRFTPPVHSLMAFQQALLELEAEGGVAGRAARYRENFRVLMEGMCALGFEPYLEPSRQGYIINTFHSPADARYHFEEFYRRLNELGYVIYPGKLTRADCFRVGNIGRLYPEDIRGLLRAVAAVKAEMGFEAAPAVSGAH